jgi:hypothetical protein
MRRFGQLSADEQAAAVSLALTSLGLDGALLADPDVRPKLDALAQRRAKAALYVDPGDQIVTLPAATTTPPPAPTPPPP